MSAQVLAGGSDFVNGYRVNVFVACDSEPAKQTVQSIAKSMCFDVVDNGQLKIARYLKPVASLNIYLGCSAGLGTGIARPWIHKT